MFDEEILENILPGRDFSRPTAFPTPIRFLSGHPALRACRCRQRPGSQSVPLTLSSTTLLSSLSSVANRSDDADRWDMFLNSAKSSASSAPPRSLWNIDGIVDENAWLWPPPPPPLTPVPTVNVVPALFAKNELFWLKGRSPPPPTVDGVPALLAKYTYFWQPAGDGDDNNLDVIDAAVRNPCKERCVHSVGGRLGFLSSWRGQSMAAAPRGLATRDKGICVGILVIKTVRFLEFPASFISVPPAERSTIPTSSA